MCANEESDFIPDKLYNQIMKLMPIVSIEAVIMIDEGLLLLRRKNEPAKGEWWFPGGRIKKVNLSNKHYTGKLRRKRTLK